MLTTHANSLQRVCLFPVMPPSLDLTGVSQVSRLTRCLCVYHRADSVSGGGAAALL